MDEEISEDEAFNSEDERKYGDIVEGFTFRKEPNKDDNEGDNMNEEDDGAQGGGGMLLSDILEKSIASSSSKSERDEEKSRKQLIASLGLEDKSKRGKERSEISREDEFHFSGVSRKNTATNGGLSIADLLPSHASTQSADSTLRQRMLNIRKEAVLKPAIAPIVAARSGRKIAYKETQKDLKKWVPLVQENRRKEHLSFVATNQSVRQKLTTATMVSQHVAESDMEKRVKVLLEASNQGSSANANREETQAMMSSRLTFEELSARRKEVQRMRALMSYKEQKHKRVKKIKSKLYRKIRKKKRKREDAEKSKLLAETDPEKSKQMEEKEIRERIQLRMSLKHRNLSKWTKKRLKIAGGASMDELREREELHQVILSKRERKQLNGDTPDDDDDGGDEATVDDIRGDAASVLREIDGDGKDAKALTGMFALKFMQNSLEKQRRGARVEAEKLLREIEGTSANAKVAADNGHLAEVARVDGRRSFKGGNNGNGTKGGDSSTLSEREQHRSGVESLDDSCQVTRAETYAGRVTSLETSTKTSFAVPSFAPVSAVEDDRCGRAGASTKTSVDSVGNDDEADVDVATVIRSLRNADDAENASDDSTKTAGAARTDEDAQKEAVKAAFMGAGIEEEFTKEKDRMIENEIGPRIEEPAAAKGWGSWTGEGVVISKRAARTRQKKAAAKKLAAEEKRNKIRMKRRDAHTPHLILNEKRNKKASKYTIKSVPYPFKTRAQYEKTLKRSIGKESNTSRFVDKYTKEAVHTRAGVIITPATLPKRLRKGARRSGRRGK
eukprot:g857.t1